MYSQSCVVVLVCYFMFYLCIGIYVLVCYVVYVVYLFVLSHHATSTHVLHSQPHASRWTAYLLPPRGAVWDLQHSVLMLNGDNCMHFYTTRNEVVN